MSSLLEKQIIATHMLYARDRGASYRMYLYINDNDDLVPAIVTSLDAEEPPETIQTWSNFVRWVDDDWVYVE